MSGHSPRCRQHQRPPTFAARRSPTARWWSGRHLWPHAGERSLPRARRCGPQASTRCSPCDAASRRSGSEPRGPLWCAAQALDVTALVWHRVRPCARRRFGALGHSYTSGLIDARGLCRARPRPRPGPERDERTAPRGPRRLRVRRVQCAAPASSPAWSPQRTSSSGRQRGRTRPCVAGGAHRVFNAYKLVRYVCL